MKTIVENVINSGRYDLSEMLNKIDTLWLQGSISDDDKAELVELARSKATPENSYASLQIQVDALAKAMLDLEARVAHIEEGEPDEPPAESDEWPEYKAPTGAHDAHYNGAKVTFNGEHYICVAPVGVACVWSPAEYPAYWEKQS